MVSLTSAGLSYALVRPGPRSLFHPCLMMQTATYRPSPMPTAPSTANGDPVRTSVAHLLARAHGIPCTAAAQAFAQLVQPVARFGIALDVLLPLLSGHHSVVVETISCRYRLLQEYVLQKEPEKARPS